MTVETRRRQIEDAASVLFRERGYAATSVRDIAQQLNLQGGSLYAHVASKEDLLWSIVSRAADRFAADVGPLARSDGPAAERLRRMIGAHVAVVTSAQREAVVFLHEWRLLSPARRAEMAGRRDAYESLFRSVIDDGVRRGEFVAIDPRMSAMVILSALNGIAGWYRPDGELSAGQIATQYADLFLRSLGSSADRPAASGHERPAEANFLTRETR